MRFVALSRESLYARSVEGLVLAHDVRGDKGSEVRFSKGRILRDEDRESLSSLSWEELHVVQPEPGDLHESVAGERIACAAAGRGVSVGKFSGGHWPLAAAHRGIVEVAVEAVNSVNATEGLCVYTLFHGHVVERDETVGRAKITPFVIGEEAVASAERVSRLAGGLVSVRPFLKMRVSATVQESLGTDAMRRFERALGEKVAWFGSELLPAAYVAATRVDIAKALREQVDAGAGVLVIAGTRAMDDLDPAFLALADVGAQRVRLGVPAHPGSLFWIARLGDVPVVGMPSCSLFSQATVFDLVLPRLLTGERVGRDELAALGHGGYLTRDMAYRVPPYRAAQKRGEVAD